MDQTEHRYRMCLSGGTSLLLLLLLLLFIETATSSPVHTDSTVKYPPPPLSIHFTPPPNTPAILSPAFPIRPSSSTLPSPTSSLDEALAISPPRLVVRFGDPFTANCSMRGKSFSLMGWAVAQVTEEIVTSEDTFLVLRVDNVTEWNVKATCYALGIVQQVVRELDATVYKLPDRVSISLDSHSGPMVEGRRYTLRCHVQDVAPLQNLSVTFHRGSQMLGPPLTQPSSARSPLTASFTAEVIPQWEDDGRRFWCEAKLDLGADGPQLAAMKSNELTASVHFGPQILCPKKVRVRPGDGLACEVRGNPAPRVTWRRDGQEIGTLALLSREHAGNYTVHATGGLGTAACVVEVEVGDRGTSHACSGLALVAVLSVHMGSCL